VTGNIFSHILNLGNGCEWSALHPDHFMPLPGIKTFVWPAGVCIHKIDVINKQYHYFGIF